MADRNPLDPFRIVLNFVQDADLLAKLGNAAGLKFDLTVSEKEAVSHKTRVRALLPRLLASYDALGDEARLLAARIAVTELLKSGTVADKELRDSLAKAGWELRDPMLWSVLPRPERCSSRRGRSGMPTLC